MALTTGMKMDRFQLLKFVTKSNDPNWFSRKGAKYCQMVNTYIQEIDRMLNLRSTCKETKVLAAIV